MTEADALLRSCVPAFLRFLRFPHKQRGFAMKPLVLHLDYSVILLGIEAGTDLAAVQVTMADDSCIRETFL